MTRQVDQIRSLFDVVLDVVDYDPFECAMVDLSIALRGQLNDKRSTQFALCLRKTANLGGFLAAQALLG